MNAVTRPTRSRPWQAVFDAMLYPKRHPMDDQESLYLYDARQGWLPFQNQTLTTWHWGVKGPRVLLVHGWESRSTHWHAWIPVLVAAGWRVSALDLPAHGHSSGRSTHVVQAGQAVLALEKQVGTLNAVVGHSMGSAAALYAFAHGLSVKASVHLAGPVSLTGVLHRAGLAGQLDEAERHDLIHAFANHHDLDLHVMELASLSNGFRHAALIQHDVDDKEIPITESRQLAQAWPGSELKELQGLGHRRILRDPELINRTVDWLTRQTIAESNGE